MLGMEYHRYQVGDKVWHRTDLTGGNKPLYQWWLVEILECVPTPTCQFVTNAPHYIVRRDGGHRRFLTDETYLNPVKGVVYPSWKAMTDFERRCREIEPIEVIEGRVQPLSPWTESKVRCQMARERADTERHRFWLARNVHI